MKVNKSMTGCLEICGTKSNVCIWLLEYIIKKREKIGQKIIWKGNGQNFSKYVKNITEVQKDETTSRRKMQIKPH